MNLTIQEATDIAISTAHESNMERYKLGAVIFDKKKHVSACNYLIGVKTTRENPWSLHAEEAAIIKGSRQNIDFKNSILVVVRINKSNNLCMARPCKNCQSIIQKHEIPTVYYSQ
jgi:deoxycytidylate deaminase